MRNVWSTCESMATAHLASLFPRKNRRTKFGEGRIASGVVGVLMGIDEVFDGGAAELSNGRQHFVTEWRILSIDHQDALGAN